MKDSSRVTVGIVTADSSSAHAKRCIESVKAYTPDCDLIVLDNNKDPHFRHSREMNRIMARTRTGRLVLMDDDVFVCDGWLEGMLRCLNPSVGVVTPLHENSKGLLSYAGIAMRPDYTGRHSHILAKPDGPTRIATICSAIVLIDMAKCGHISFCEDYVKYFLDIDYGLRVWEAGFEVVLSPYATVTHIGGGTRSQEKASSFRLSERDRETFIQTWIHTGRYSKLEAGVWARVPEIQEIAHLTDKIDALISAWSESSPSANDVIELRDRIAPIPALKDYCGDRIQAVVRAKKGEGDRSAVKRLKELRGMLLPSPPLRTKILQGEFDIFNHAVLPAGSFAVKKLMGQRRYEELRRGHGELMRTIDPLPFQEKIKTLFSAAMKRITREGR